MSWNRTYRPHSIAQLHLTSVRTALQSLVDQKKIPQVFLFTGPKGTGKTSASRIIGALVNEPANKEVVTSIFITKKEVAQSFVEPDFTQPFIQKILSGNSFVVQEMDAASNRGIDNIRELKERIALPPQEGVMTVYILDEAHMLTTEAGNALLKILEEPPSHVIVILATTELHKIPETIVSRCHVVPFTKATPAELVTALTTVATAEKLTAQPEALLRIAQHADGSFRDAIKLLEMLSVDKKLTLAQVETALASSTSSTISECITAVTSKDAVGVVTLFEKLRAAGTDQKYFHTQLLQTLHATLLAHHGIGKASLELSEAATLFLLKAFAPQTLSTDTAIPFLNLEITALEIISRAKQKNSPQKAQTKAEFVATAPTITLPLPITQTELPPSKKQIAALQTITISSDINPVQPSEVSAHKGAQNPGSAQRVFECWGDFVDTVCENNNTVGALLRSARPIEAEEDKLTVGVYYRFHQEQLSEKKFLTKIQETVEQFAEGRIDLVFTLIDATAPASLGEVATQDAGELTDFVQLASESLM